MNISSLPIYYSKENITTRYSDYSNVYVLPSICGFGIATSLICIIVSFVKRDESNAKSLDYILINSLIDFLFLLIQFFLVIIRCGILCPYGNTFGAKFYEIYIYLYVGYVLVSSQLFLSIYIAYDRLSMFSAKAGSKKSMSLFMIYLVCLVISILANLAPYVISREVIPLGILMSNPNSTEYEILYVKSFKPDFQTPTANSLLTANLFIKDIVMFVVLCILNIWLCVKFRAYLNSRKSLVKKTTTATSERSIAASNQQTNDTDTKRSQAQAEKKENNFTLLTLLYCLIYVIGNFIDSFGLIANIFSLDIYVKYWYFNIFGNCLFFASHGVHIFLYYFFNNVFRKHLNDLFHIR